MIIDISKGKPTIPPVTCTPLYTSFLSQLSWVPATLGETTGTTFKFTGNSTFNFNQAIAKEFFPGGIRNAGARKFNEICLSAN